MKSLISIALFFVTFYASGQDRILKTDGTVIKGTVISFQNNRLVVLQEDETEMTLPRKAIAEIKFDYQEQGKVAAKSVEKPQPSVPIVAAPASVTPALQEERQEERKEERKEEKKVPTSYATAPTQTVVLKKNALNSPGEVVGFGERSVVQANALKEKAIGVGRVAVAVCVNSEGIVTSAKFKAVGSSTIDADLINAAVQNAKAFKFSQDKGEDCGVITYKFNME